MTPRSPPFDRPKPYQPIPNPSVFLITAGFLVPLPANTRIYQYRLTYSDILMVALPQWLHLLPPQY